MKQDRDWQEDDSTWRLLEKATSNKAGGRFADDVLRKVRTMPEKKSIWSGMFVFAPWAAAAACAALAAFFLTNQPGESSGGSNVVASSSEEEWSEIEDVAEVEILSAAAEHLDEFSDDELIAMIGL